MIYELVKENFYRLYRDNILHNISILMFNFKFSV